MLTLSEAVNLSIGSITVSENTFETNQEKNRLENQFPEIITGSPTYDYFCRVYYSPMAAVSSGPVPSAKNAYDLPRDQLDLWFMVVWKLNPDWFIVPYAQELKSKVVTFRDGSKVQLTETGNLPSYMLRLYEYERVALTEPSENKHFQVFRSVFYPKMAACMIGAEIPPAEEIFSWPTSELNKWYEAARDLNPIWFESLDDVSEEARAALAAKEKAIKKKASKKRDG